MMWTLVLLLLHLFPQQDKNRIMEYNGSRVMTTYDVEERFLGKYSGRKSGFLELRSDGSGTYRYDIFGFALSGCKSGPIEFDWGFMVDEQGDILRFERDYGYSYPVLMKSLVENSSFQGCRKEIMLDFIIEKDGKLNVSSSDDWSK